jgi:hypothetical protein
MKKILFTIGGLLLVSTIHAQNISDALRYGNTEIQGSARFRALSGAFGALGGDMSAVSINPAGSAIFSVSHASFSLGINNKKNKTAFFGTQNSEKNGNFDLTQGGAAFVFKTNNESSKFKKFILGLAYDKTGDFDNDWFASGNNTNNSIGNYFLQNAQGLRLDQISAFPGESTSDAYSGIGSAYGSQNQQAYLGYDSYILEPNDITDNGNTLYTSNIATGNYNQEYNYASTGYNGKLAFNFATQYTDKFYFGLNLNSHFLNYERSTFLYEENDNGGTIKQVAFQNNLTTTGNGFSFQLGSIMKLSNEVRFGLSYNSPTWYTIEDQTTQSVESLRDDAGTDVLQIVDPRIVNVFPRYRLQTPSSITGSLAYIFGTSGLISFDYGRKNYGNTKFKPTSDTYFSELNNSINDQLTAANIYKIGGEYRIKQLSLRAGYRFEESPYKNKTTVGDLSGYSLGLGYSFGNTKLDLTYDTAQQDRNQSLYNVGLTDAAAINSKISNITLSLGFNL